MNIASHPYESFDWKNIPKEERKGDTGHAFWQIKMLDNIRVRRVEYSPGYKADHWCSKGHVVFCIEGGMDSELADGRTFRMEKGMSYLVGDNNEPHRSSTEEGCVLFIVD